MRGLTQQEHSALCAVADWKAVYEVAAALYPSGSNFDTRRKIRQTLDRLLRQKLVEHHDGNDTYRVTNAGHNALASS